MFFSIHFLSSWHSLLNSHGYRKENHTLLNMLLYCLKVDRLKSKIDRKVLVGKSISTILTILKVSVAKRKEWKFELKTLQVVQKPLVVLLKPLLCFRLHNFNKILNYILFYENRELSSLIAFLREQTERWNRTRTYGLFEKPDVVAFCQ